MFFKDLYNVSVSSLLIGTPTEEVSISDLTEDNMGVCWKIPQWMEGSAQLAGKITGSTCYCHLKLASMHPWTKQFINTASSST
jgi:hypothetical protein